MNVTLAGMKVTFLKSKWLNWGIKVINEWFFLHASVKTEGQLLILYLIN